ncbi:cyclic pyranopterin monophosphate synthase MoaC [Sediminivirga luteola]|nr:cyclic pyranopterin monophosphate synthase MoaC [Sediminivirga luteola]MCI2265914.1 cyclic pyranopterin monophosphate synthase MoaC [Sediminivirga luteola]
MVDITAKPVTARTATAGARVRMSAEALELLSAGELPKGDALAVARLAGIQAVKKTPDLVPLAHPIAVHGVDVALVPGTQGVDISVTVRTADRTGIEMEALTGASVAALSLIDMIKAVDRSAWIEYVRIDHKSGGRSGEYSRDRR